MQYLVGEMDAEDYLVLTADDATAAANKFLKHLGYTDVTAPFVLHVFPVENAIKVEVAPVQVTPYTLNVIHGVDKE
jgi:hypothetical protein